MTEQITANPESGRKPIGIEISGVFKIPEGAETKHVLEGRVGRRRIFLVEREFNQSYINNWHIFRKAGLPVVPTLRVSSRNTLLVTDIKADGSEIYGKSLLTSLHDIHEIRSRPRLNVDRVFLQLTQPGNFQSIDRKTKEYLDIANSERIRLPFDDPFEFVVHPDGSWELMILDLTYGYAIAESVYSYHVNELREQNTRATRDFLAQLQYIRRELSKQKPSFLKQLWKKFKRYR
ncbi:hypothetical protein HYU96_01415 [Candidatus Daviesbacteria bacterium]|nr:hypothetical protein [Candidatus Daviesbacteria bacterium]